MAEGWKVDKPCEGCGVIMTNVNPKKRFCPDCVKQWQKEYQRQYRERIAEDKKPQVIISNPYRKYCKGCVYWGGGFDGTDCCNYIFIEGHSRQCPPGKGCTKKIVGKRKRIRDVREEQW